MLENGLYKNCTILSIQIQDNPPVDRKKIVGVPAPGLNDQGGWFGSGGGGATATTTWAESPTLIKICWRQIETS